MQWQRDGYEIDTDRERLDFLVIHSFLSEESYWAKGRSLEVVRRSIENSLPFGIFHGGGQVGFGRVVTDYATFAWVADVFVLPGHRGRGLAAWMLEIMLAHPDLQGLRRWALATKDAHQLYDKLRFRPLRWPARWMERPGDGLQESPDYWATTP